MGGGLRQCAAAGNAAIRAGQPSDACRGRGCTQDGQPGQQQQVRLHLDALHALSMLLACFALHPGKSLAGCCCCARIAY